MIWLAESFQSIFLKIKYSKLIMLIFELMYQKRQIYRRIEQISVNCVKLGNFFEKSKKNILFCQNKDGIIEIRLAKYK